jgi:type IV pilus assembly protein PilZ
VVELRRYVRAPIDVAVEFVAKGSTASFPGRATDVSLGGMFIRTSRPASFSAEIRVRVTLPGQKAAFDLPAVVRWTRPDGMGIQFGLLGARETHAIISLAPRH